MFCRPRLSGWAARLALFVVFAEHSASAQTASIAWERRAGAEGCASAREITARVEKVLERPVFTSGTENPIVVRGAASRDARGYRVEIAVIDRARREKESRLVRVSGQDCRKIDAALALVLAMAIEPRLPAATEPRTEPSAGAAGDTPGAGVEGIATSPVDATAPRATSASQPQRGDTPGNAPARSEAKPAPPRSVEEEKPEHEGDSASGPAEQDRAPRSPVRSWAGSRITVTGGARVTEGLMPAPTTGLAMDVGWRPLAFVLTELGVSHFPYGRRPTTVGDAEFRATFGVVRLCATLPWRRLRFDACATGDLGVFGAHGRGFDVARYESSRFMSMLGGALRVSARPVSHFVVRAGVSLGAPFQRDTFVLDTTSNSSVELHRVSPVVTSLLLDGGWEFD